MDKYAVWVKADDRPLVVPNMKGGWVVTEDGSKDFIAAIPYYDKRKPGVKLWWIRHCCIEDNSGLCVVGDDDNEPAGWEIEGIEYWMPLPKCPDENPSPVDRGVEKAGQEMTIDEISRIQSSLLEVAEKMVYWEQRCEAAEKVISCIPDRKENLYELGFHQALKIWQTLKGKQL